MKKLVLYVHGKYGTPAESEHYKPLFPDCRVIGLEYQARFPWETGKEIHEEVIRLKEEGEAITIIANSIGAYYCMCSGIDLLIQEAFFISPVVDMENLIESLMKQVGITETELKEKKTIRTASGEELSWDYLNYTRTNPIIWNAPTKVLYGSKDSLTSYEQMVAFSKMHSAELTVMEDGEHWFHTEEQMRFLDEWVQSSRLEN